MRYNAVRCPPGNQQERNRILAYFYCHLAKGIYADVCYWRPINFMEVRKGVDDLRSAYFLDGPNDVDWIFDNSIIQQREDDLYVGYVREDTQEEGQGNCHWTSPVSGVSSLTNKMLGSTTPAILQLARALYDVKATSFEGLPVIAEIWRSVGLHDEMRFDELEQTNLKTLEALKDCVLKTPVTEEVRAHIQHRWIFPLWPLDLRLLPSDRKERLDEKKRLREVQKVTRERSMGDM